LSEGDLITRLGWLEEKGKNFRMTFTPVGWADERSVQMIGYIDANRLMDKALGNDDVAMDPVRVSELLQQGGLTAPPPAAQAPPQGFQLPPRSMEDSPGAPSAAPQYPPASGLPASAVAPWNQGQAWTSPPAWQPVVHSTVEPVKKRGPGRPRLKVDPLPSPTAELPAAPPPAPPPLRGNGPSGFAMSSPPPPPDAIQSALDEAMRLTTKR